MVAGDSSTRIRSRVFVTADDLDLLYILCKGSPFANTLVDAQGALSVEDYARVQQIVQSARDMYEQSHRSVLRRDLDNVPENAAAKTSAAQTRRLEKKQEKHKKALAEFDDVLARLPRMVERQRRQEAEQRISAANDRRFPKGFAERFASAPDRDAKEKLLQEHFKLKKVRSDEDLQTDALYYFRSKDHACLLTMVAEEPAGESTGEFTSESISLQDALSHQRLKPVSRKEFIEWGNQRRLIRLEQAVVLNEAKEEKTVSPQPDSPTPADEPSSDAAVSSNAPNVNILDMGAFTQLYDAAKRTGMIPNFDVIANVRDREFRMQKYEKAFQVIEGLFGKFSAAATQRQQRLRREDTDIASGKMRISPKKLQEKRYRDNSETQLIERARHRFLRVMEGLRVLMRTQ